MKTTMTQRTKIYGDWGQLQGIMVWNYELTPNVWGELKNRKLMNTYFVQNKNYKSEIV